MHPVARPRFCSPGADALLGGGELGGCWGPSECWVSRSGGEWTPGGVPLVRSQEGAGSMGWGETVAPGLPRSGRSLSKIGLPLQLLL